MMGLKDERKNSRNENLEKKLEINFTKIFCEVNPKNLEKKNSRFFFSSFG
jgi:hypothetical protein